MSKRGEWPKEIVVCLECGKVSHTGNDWVGPCQGNDPMHGPTQKVLVVPKSTLDSRDQAIKELVEAAGRFLHQASPNVHSKVALSPGRKLLAEADLRAAVASAKQTLGGDQ